MRVNIFWIDNNELGRIGIMPRPRGGDWLEDEVCSLKVSGVDVIVSLLEQNEIAELELDQEQSLCEGQGIQYISFPIIDRSVPISRQETRKHIDVLAEHVRKGKNIVIHCRQGVGRSAVIAACILTCQGVKDGEAFELIAAARGCTVPDTPEQREWVEEYAKAKGRAV